MKGIIPIESRFRSDGSLLAGRLAVDSLPGEVKNNIPGVGEAKLITIGSVKIYLSKGMGSIEVHLNENGYFDQISANEGILAFQSPLFRNDFIHSLGVLVFTGGSRPELACIDRMTNVYSSDGKPKSSTSFKGREGKLNLVDHTRIYRGQVEQWSLNRYSRLEDWCPERP